MSLLEVSEFGAGYHKILVDNVHFQVNEHEIVGVLGHNGCGKSTLLKGIMQTIKTKGKAFVDKKDIAKMSMRQRAQNITMLSQRYDGIEGVSAFDIIAMARYAYSPFWKLEYDECEIKRLSLELGVEHLLDCDFMSLSEGQKQLIHLVRVFYQDTKMILLDEPDSSLDYDNKHLFYRYLRCKVKQQRKGVLVVLHDPLLALMYCDRILLMDQGRICDEIDVKDDIDIMNRKLRQLYQNIDIQKDQKKNQFYIVMKEDLFC